jgi:hypothetical protein
MSDRLRAASSNATNARPLAVGVRASLWMM